MRCVQKVPARQLGSVAQRYRGILDRSISRSRRVRPWWTLGSASGPRIVSDGEKLVAGRQRLEAVLLVAREPINSRKLAQYARLSDGTEARTLVRQLNECYDAAGRAFRIEEIGGGFRLLTRPQFARWLGRLPHVPPQVRLSAPAMETLAVVAYRQPVVRAEVEAIRGVSCGEILRQLMERDLVRIGGRSDELGRPYLYATTKRFLEVFGLRTIEDLPRTVALRELEGTVAVTAAESQEAPRSTDESEQEKSEVSVTSPTELPVEEFLTETTRKTVVVAEGDFDDNDEDYDAAEYDEEDYDDDEDEDDEDDEDYEIEDDGEDEFSEDEWEEVEDDEFDDEEEGDWEDDEEWSDDEDWDEDDEDDDDADWY